MAIFFTDCTQTPLPTNTWLFSYHRQVVSWGPHFFLATCALTISAVKREVEKIREAVWTRTLPKLRYCWQLRGSPEQSRSLPTWQASEGEGKGKDERARVCPALFLTSLPFYGLSRRLSRSHRGNTSPQRESVVAVTNIMKATKTSWTSMYKEAKQLVTFTKYSATWQENKMQYLITRTTYLESSDFFL